MLIVSLIKYKCSHASTLKTSCFITRFRFYSQYLRTSCISSPAFFTMTSSHNSLVNSMHLQPHPQTEHWVLPCWGTGADHGHFTVLGSEFLHGRQAPGERPHLQWTLNEWEVNSTVKPVKWEVNLAMRPPKWGHVCY